MSALPQGTARVLFVSLYTEMGGGEVALFHLVKELDRRKYEPLVLFNGAGPLRDRMEAAGIRCRVLPFPVLPLSRLAHPAALAKVWRASLLMKRVVREERADLIHCADVLTLVMLLPAAIRYRLPVVYTVVFYYERLRLILFNVLALLTVGRVVTVSDRLAADLKRRTFFLGKRIETVHPGVDSSEFRPLQEGEWNGLRSGLHLPGNVPLAGMVARFEPAKGHRYLLEAVRELKRRGRILKLIIAGGVPNAGVLAHLREYREETIRLAHDLGLEEDVIFLGHREDVAGLLRCLDVLICPSVSEGFGLVVLEALASGVPVVASHAVGALEAAGGAPGIFLAKPADVESLCGAIERAIAAGGRPPDSGTKAAEFAHAWSWAHQARAMESIYARLSAGQHLNG